LTGFHAGCRSAHDNHTRLYNRWFNTAGTSSRRNRPYRPGHRRKRLCRAIRPAISLSRLPSKADWLVIVHDGENIGRLYVERWPSQHCIIDIAFLPAYRGKGLGSALLADLLDEAAAAGKAVSIHVEKYNPAMRLYRRLGFVTIEDKGVYDLMRWTPSAVAAPT
jgi:GNAT superfamily N-acetyltransferase